MSKEMRRDPNDPEMAREEIERTRERMSGTLDQIEDVLLRKKEELEQKKADFERKLDVGARIREEPLLAAGIVLGAGFLVGFLTGGDSRNAVRSARRSRAKWEKRAHRLLEIARSQEEELEDLRILRESIGPDGYEDADLFEDEEEDDDDGSFLDEDDLRFDPDALTGEDIYPLDPEFDDETIEYRPASARRGGSLRDRIAEFAADAVDSVLDAVPKRR